ncbi:MAG: hypothetical protein NT154_02375 [Verrucomicrobia bacterium]|nr:hypothetical protein [Verrucomicrobiota bacterium]
MNRKFLVLIGAAACSLFNMINSASAFTTAFTYQGRLADNGSPASGNYDMRFSIWDSAVGGLQVGGPVVVAPVGVSSGLFTVPLDFGVGVFTGPDRWLQIESRVFGGGAYSLIPSRQKLTPIPYAIAAGSVSATPGAVPDVSLSANVAQLNRTPQTFTGANIFDRGVGGPGRLIVTGSSSPDLTNFTGLGFQYYDSSGEGAIMSSYNDGYGYLSFYTKQGLGQPITKQMIISQFGDVAIDYANHNDGVLNNGTAGGAGLTFGLTSGEGIASKRTGGGNQYGLDFYTDFVRRMSLSNSGNLSFVDPLSSIIFPATTNANNPMIFMFDSGTVNTNRMVIAHSPAFANWGLQYEDASDKFHFLSGGTDVMTVDLSAQNVGIGTATPAAKLDVRGDVKLGSTGQYFATGGAENLRILRGIVRPDGTIYDGSGFTVAHTGTGTYTITFSPAFADTPSLVLTPYTGGSPDVANCTGGTSAGYAITTWVGAAKADTWFNVMAIGAR